MKTKLLGLTEHLKPAFDPVTSERMAKTYAGMAHFAGTGPFNKTCGDCQHRGYYRQSQKARFYNGKEMLARSYRTNGCEQFKKLTGTHGHDVPMEACACKYFSSKETKN